MQNLKIWNYISFPWLIFTLIFFIVFFFNAFFGESDTKFISYNYLKNLFQNTFLLSIMSAILSALIAVPLAILVTFYKFPGHKFFSWSLSLSIAFPAYVYAFIFVGIFEYSSPLSEYLRSFDLYLPSIKNVYGASIIMSMALFPYIFLITKAQLSSVGLNVFRAARSLGDSNLAAIRKVVLPSLKPTVIAGMALVIFETISDFGGVSTLRVETFTVGIYDAWFGYQSYLTASKLAGFLLIFVFLIMFISKNFGKERKNVAFKTAEIFEKIELKWFKQVIISCICFLIFIIIFCIPLFQLLIWQLSEMNISLLDNIKFLLNSLIIGSLVSIFTVFIAVGLSLSYRGSAKLRFLISISSSGYAIPGSVVSAGLLIGFYTLFGSSITLYGIYALLLCLCFRFMTPAFNYISSSLTNISSSSEHSLSTQPRNYYRSFLYFYFPQMKPAIFLSVLIVFIESIKEQPATLLLRPVGFDTLSTKIYNYTSEGQWEMAASPSLLLVFLSLIFVYLINKSFDHNKRY